MLRVEWDASGALERLAQLPDAIERERPQMLAAVGAFVRDAAARDFATKARGGTGADGVKWPPLARSTRKRVGTRPIGGSIGAIANIVAETDGESVVIRFRHPRAVVFDAQRPLLPKRLPRPWYRSCQRIVQSRLDALLTEL